VASDWFKGTPDIPPAKSPAKIDSIDRARFFGPDAYDAEPGLADAVNTALLLAQPLLVSGEPGTGKTQLAEKMALELGLPLCKFETRSTSVAQDLFYHFDHVARFQTAQSDTNKAALDPLNFIEFGALGRAIVESLPRADAATLFPEGRLPDWYGGPRRAIVLIDEIDKAPSDFPNDALNEVERHYFRIREVGGGRVVSAAEALRPIIVITSNSEKQLPDAFLRRCVYHHIEFPADEGARRKALQDILDERLKGVVALDGQGYQDALDAYFFLRDLSAVEKKPSTSELLDWIQSLQRCKVDWSQPAAAQADRFLACLGALAKTESDKQALGDFVSQSAGRRR